MSTAHIEALIKALEDNHWVIVEQLEDEPQWKIAHPNGDTPLRLEFSLFGNMDHGGLWGDETIEHNGIACPVKGHPEIDLYFHRISKGFDKHLSAFIKVLNQLK